MRRANGSARPSFGPGLMIVGGSLAGLGSFLAWAKLEAGPDSATAKGVDGSDGYVTLVAGLVIVVCGLVSVARPRRSLAILAIVGGIGAAGIGLYDAVTAEDSAIDALASELAGGFGVSESQATALLREAVDQGLVSITLRYGIYLVIGGGALGIVGGAVQMARRDVPAAPSSTPHFGMADLPPAPPHPPDR